MTHRLVETLTRFTPLGVRFWDVGTARPVRAGLRVTAWPEGASGAGTTAFLTTSGVYALQDLPGLRDVEWGDAPASGPGVVPLQRRYVVAVQDTEGRFVPTAFVIDLPREELGIYPPPVAGSLGDEAVPGYYLFSSASRATPAGTAVVRAQLEDAVTGAPAAHAVLAVEVDGETWYGLADRAGAVSAVFPVPAFHHTLTGSYPEGGTPLYEYAWPLTVRVRYAPGAVETPPEAGVPLLRSLFDQPEALLYGVAPGSLAPEPPDAALAASLVYGRDTTLRSEGRSSLLVEPAVSFP